MNIKVDDNILKKTTKCREKFSCLSGGTPFCRVELCIEDTIHFIKCVSNKSCVYKVPFGYSYVCICPVRKELYNRYKIQGWKVNIIDFCFCDLGIILENWFICINRCYHQRKTTTKFRIILSYPTKLLLFWFPHLNSNY